MFIHNELVVLKKQQIDFKIFSLFHSSDRWLKHPVLHEILKHHFCCMNYWIYLKGLAQALREPKVFLQHIRWILTLKHKNFLFCLRVVSALLIAYGMRNYILREKFQYLHAHFVSYPTEIVMCLSRLTGIPYGASSHAFDIWRDDNILSEKIHYSHQIIANTKYNYEHLKLQASTVNAHKLQLIYNSVDFSHLPKLKPLQQNYPLLAVGRLVPKKGFCYLVDAIALLKQQGVIVKVNIVGASEPWIDRITSGEGSELKRLQKKIKRYELEDQVTLLGYLPHYEVLTLMNDSSALVMPCVRDKHNNIDGIPNVILEAMAMQRPIITSRLSGIPEVVIDGDTGLLVEPEDVAGLAEAIMRLSKNPTLTHAMSLRAHDFALHRFDLNKNSEKICALFC